MFLMSKKKLFHSHGSATENALSSYLNRVWGISYWFAEIATTHLLQYMMTLGQSADTCYVSTVAKKTEIVLMWCSLRPMWKPARDVELSSSRWVNIAFVDDEDGEIRILKFSLWNFASITHYGESHRGREHSWLVLQRQQRLMLNWSDCLSLSRLDLEPNQITSVLSGFNCNRHEEHQFLRLATPASSRCWCSHNCHSLHTSGSCLHRVGGWWWTDLLSQ